jgi:hypothetical protein
MRAIAGILMEALICIAAVDARADKRVALTIGNSKYQHVPNLLNPANDASAVGLLLKSAGFDVVALENVGVNDMRRAVRISASVHGMPIGGVITWCP